MVGLQEFQPQQYDKWVKKASGQYDIFPGYIDTPGFLRNSIAWRKDKFRLVSTSWLKLPYFKGDVLRMPVVLLQSLQTGQQIYFMNFQNPADVRGNALKYRLTGQALQINLVNQLRASNGLPIVWTGDMNSREQVFCRVTKQAAMVSASGGYRSESSCQPPKGMVVDWIFGSGRAVLELRPGAQPQGGAHQRPPPALQRRDGAAGAAGHPGADGAADDPDADHHGDGQPDPADRDGHADDDGVDHALTGRSLRRTHDHGAVVRR